MDVFSHDNYKSLVRAWIRTQPKHGYGQFRKMAMHLNVGSVFISQVFKSDRDLSVDQGLLLAGYMGLMNLEKEYFFVLVQKARATTPDLREFLQAKLDALKLKSKNLKERVDSDRELTDTEKARFYSDWYYSGIRNLAAVPGYGTVKKLAERLELPLPVVQEAVDFLLESGLCQLKAGRLEVGPKLTHLEASSPLIKNRQIHWRMKAIEQMSAGDASQLFYTCPMSLSLKTKQEVRGRIVSLIQEIMKEVKDSPSQDVACLNIDWFTF